MRNGGLPSSERSMQEFQDVIDSYGLIDPGYIGPNYTWCNKHFNSDIIWERLDRFLLNSEMQDKCNLVKVDHLALIASDHKPLLAEWMEDKPGLVKNRPWRNEEVWTKYGECKDIVHQVWQDSNHQVNTTIQTRTKECLNRLACQIWWID